MPVEQDPIAEDWGWVVLVRGHPFMLWVGCRNAEDGAEADWTLFIQAEPSLFQRLFRRVDTAPAVAALKRHLESVVREAPGAEAVTWT